jgi:integrase
MKGKFRFHDSRHAFASIVLKNGTSVKEVAELLRHASPTVTLSAYAHQMEGVGRAAVDALAASVLEGRRAEPCCEQM